MAGDGMLARRLAVAVGLMLALVASQLPEFVQQYRQRLGGALDELKAVVAGFDADAAHQSLTRDQGVARLRDNADPLARARGDDIVGDVARIARLERQRDDFARSGPLSQYAVLFAGLDPGLARGAYADYQPAVPVTTAGLVSGGTGLAAGWLLTHAVAWPFRRRRDIAQPRPSRA